MCMHVGPCVNMCMCLTCVCMCVYENVYVRVMTMFTKTSIYAYSRWYEVMGSKDIKTSTVLDCMPAYIELLPEWLVTPIRY